MIKEKQFYNYLKQSQYSENTIAMYMNTLNKYIRQGYTDTTVASLQRYKKALIDKGLKPASINLNIQVLNTYNQWNGHPEMKVKQIKLQQRQYLDNVINDKDYDRLCKGLLNDKNYEMYFIVKLMSLTGCRVSEAFTITIDDVRKGYFDVLGKGDKSRRVWIPTKLKDDILKWKTKGPLWVDLNMKNVKYKLKGLSRRYHISETVLHCHGFRHYFGIKYMQKTKDIATLSNLLGHSNINTTSIYLKKTNSQMKYHINKAVDW